MGKNSLQILFYLLVSITLFGQGNVIKPSELVKSKKSQTTFMNYNLLSANVDRSNLDIPKDLDRVEIYDLDQSILTQLRSSNNQGVTINLSRTSLPDLTLDLVEVQLTAADWRVYEAPSMDYQKYNLGKHFRGIVKGSEGSLVALSVFDDHVMGLISTNKSNGNLVLGKLEGKSQYILYEDGDIQDKMSLDCATPDSDIEYQVEELRDDAPSQRALSDCVRIYFEVDHDIYLDKGGMTGTTNYVTGLFNQVATMYANENINITLSPLVLWSEPSPYNSNSSGGMLDAFTNYRQGFDGDLAQLLSYKASGGIAYVNGLCSSNPDYSMSFSSINSTYNTVPTYSWSVMVVTHEFGHLFGSQHTHSCSWNGNNTAIDGCSSTEGNCSTPAIPSGGGTVMSYCHLTNVGINLNNGFGPQPGNLIRNRVTSANCLLACDNNGGGDGGNDDPPPPTGCSDNEAILTIKTDNYPGETTWSIVDSDGTVLYSGGPYSAVATELTFDLCLVDGCFDFVINDSYGDGICCGYGQGYYNIKDEAGVVLVEGGEFTNVATNNFCLGSDGYDNEDPIQDEDEDGVADEQDNCPTVSNTDQADPDNDGVGSVCDNCPDVSNVGQEDANGNGIGDSCETQEPDCITVNFLDTPIVSYGGGQDQGNANVFGGGNALKLTNNAWKAVNVDYEITENTIISFDFGSSAQGEIHGIGFDNNNSISSNRTFRLFGTQNWGISAFDNYSDVGYWTSYSIPVGQFYTGSFNKLFFVMDEDAQPIDGNSFFGNIQIYEGNSCALIESRNGMLLTPQEQVAAQEFKIYPNPAMDLINLNYTSEVEGNATIEIFDISGRLVTATTSLTNTGINNKILNTVNLDNGTYLVRLTVAETQSQVLKLQIIK